MQQGKMFFFIGTIMALVQGGYVRRVKRGKEVQVVKSVSQVNLYLLIRNIAKTSYISYCIYIFIFAFFFQVCLTFSLFNDRKHDPCAYLKIKILSFIYFV